MLRQRGQRLERPNAHLYETGGMRRVYLRGHTNILKRLLVQACGFNLGFLMRTATGVGTPRSLRTLQAEYETWRDQLPESLADSRTAELLEGVCDVDLDALDVELPRGFGRD